MLQEKVNIKTINPINTYIVVTTPLTLASAPTKVLKKKHTIRGRTRLAIIKQAQSDKTASAWFLSTALHSVSQAITCANTNKIAIYNNKDTAFCTESGAPEDMFPYYSTSRTYHRLSNLYATLVDTTRLHIEVIGTVVYIINGHTIINHKTLHIPTIQGPLYSPCKHRKRPGCGVYSYYKDGSYIFFPDFILQVEDSYENIVSYRSLGASYEGPIDYIESKSTGYNTMATPSGQLSTINPKPTP